MRYNVKQFAPKIGDTRHLRKFAWLPKRLRYGNDSETVWLGFYTSAQERKRIYKESTLFLYAGYYEIWVETHSY